MKKNKKDSNEIFVRFFTDYYKHLTNLISEPLYNSILQASTVAGSQEYIVDILKKYPNKASMEQAIDGFEKKETYNKLIKKCDNLPTKKNLKKLQKFLLRPDTQDWLLLQNLYYFPGNSKDPIPGFVASGTIHAISSVTRLNEIQVLPKMIAGILANNVGKNKEKISKALNMLVSKKSPVEHEILEGYKIYSKKIDNRQKEKNTLLKNFQKENFKKENTPQKHVLV